MSWKTVMRKMALLFMGVFVLGPGREVQAEEGAFCIIEKNINHKVQSPKIENYIYGLDLETYMSTGEVSFKRKPDDTQIQQWDYVITEGKGRLDNQERTLQKDSYFTLTLPKGARLGGLLHKDAVKADDIYVKNEAGEDVLFAKAHFDQNENKIYYFLTEFIEDKDWAEFDVSVNWTLEESYALFNHEKYEFTSTLAEQVSATNHFFHHRTANYEVNSVQNGTSETPLVLTVNYVNPAHNFDYELIAIYSPKMTLTRGATLEYFTDGNSTPWTEDTEVQIYKIPSGYQVPDSFYLDRGSLEDITSSFKKEMVGDKVQFTTTEALSGRFAIYTKGHFIPGAAFVSGWTITGRGEERDYSVGASQRLLENQVPSTAVAPNSGAPNFCKTQNVSVEKIWRGEGQGTWSTKVQLLRDGEPEGEPVVLNTEKPTHIWENLLIHEKKTGKPYQYQVKEVGEEAGVLSLDGERFQVEYGGNSEDGFVVINTKTPRLDPHTPKQPKQPKYKENHSKAPKTGDSSGKKTLLLLLMASISSGMIVLSARKKKR